MEQQRKMRTRTGLDRTDKPRSGASHTRPAGDQVAFDDYLGAFNWPDPEVGPWRVLLEFAPVEGSILAGDARIECVGLSFRWDGPSGYPEPLTTAVLRSFSLPSVSRVRRTAVYKGFAEVADSAELTSDQAAFAATQRDSFEPKGGGRPPTYDDAHFRAVADVYSAALSVGEPTATVARHFNVSRSAASKWVMKARDLGFLTPAEPRKAGGKRTRKGRTRGER